MGNETQIENQGKTVAIVSYLTLIGWLIAYFGLYPKAKTSLASYHLRQTLLLHIVTIAVGIVAGIIIRLATIVGYVFDVVYLVLVILWIIGFIAAIQGQEKPMPLIGEKAQTMFPKI